MNENWDQLSSILVCLALGKQYQEGEICIPLKLQQVSQFQANHFAPTKDLEQLQSLADSYFLW